MLFYSLCFLIVPAVSKDHRYTKSSSTQITSDGVIRQYYPELVDSLINGIYSLPEEKDPVRKAGMSDFEYSAVRGRVAIKLTNTFRVKNKLSPVHWSDAFHTECYGHAENMSKGVYPFSHTGFSERCARYPNPRGSCGENVAMQTGSRDQRAWMCVDQWLHSDLHRANILTAAFNAGSVAIYDYDSAGYECQMFIDDKTITEEAPIDPSAAKGAFDPYVLTWLLGSIGLVVIFGVLIFIAVFCTCRKLNTKK
ncbi:hypothetical protein BLNAU_13484 [Blattamonas nauphoetae]|uniref:SCP domain-containing protein n=1 Tax=Blattamonas nauphoetae TaxID=2049346 RepID=A0ABQ9XK73_9EUKA|nr:hypothetical protein BLNAU_13484 [Blattamonas nauphoetae]